MHVVKLDVRQPALVKETLHTLPDYWQDITILVNNAGLAAGLDPIQTGNIQDWEDMIDTNIKGLLYETRAILPHMVEKNAGHQIYPHGAVYCATKHAVNALSNGLRLDLFGTIESVLSIRV